MVILQGFLAKERQSHNANPAQLDARTSLLLTISCLQATDLICSNSGVRRGILPISTLPWPLAELDLEK